LFLGQNATEKKTDGQNKKKATQASILTMPIAKAKTAWEPPEPKHKKK
jgi:ribosomal protein L13E